MSENFSPYKAAKVVNEWLLEDGVEKVLPPQMFYNYTTARVNKGKDPLIKTDDGKTINETDLREWYTKYTARVAKLAEEKAAKQLETVEA